MKQKLILSNGGLKNDFFELTTPLPEKGATMVLQAKAVQSSGVWIVSLVDETSSCILHTCQDKEVALTYASRVNSILFPKQRMLIDRLEMAQKILNQIMKTAEVEPKTNEEFALSLHKIIRYIDLGKANAI